MSDIPIVATPLGEQPDGSYITPYEITVFYDSDDAVQTIAAHLVENAQLCDGTVPKYITPAYMFLDNDVEIEKELLERGFQYRVEYIDARITRGFCARMLADVCGKALDPNFPTCTEVAPDSADCLRAYANVHGAIAIATEISSQLGIDTEKTSEYIARGRGIREYLAQRISAQ
jgi:hypothetical protein